MAATLAELRTDLDDVAGLNLTSSERDRYINEGHVELCVRAGWTKDTLSLGPTVAGQQLYSLPSNFRKPASGVVAVGGEDFKPADPHVVRDVINSNRAIVGEGLWYMDYDGGVRKLGIYPVESAGATIQMLAVVTPSALSDPTDTTSVPDDFDSAIVSYVAALALSRDDDDIQGYQFHMSEFERQVGRLEVLLDEIESGAGPRQVQIRGVHF